MELPTWEQCNECKTPLEAFIRDNEPTGEAGSVWREQLSDMLEWTLSHKRWCGLRRGTECDCGLC